MRPKTTKIDGKKETGFIRADLHSHSATDAMGCPQSRSSRPFTLTLIREVNRPAGTTGFKQATGEDGSLQEVTAEIVIQNSGRISTHTITVEDAYLASFTDADEGSGSKEIWSIQAGHVKLTAGGKTEVFDPPWSLVPKSSKSASPQ